MSDRFRTIHIARDPGVGIKATIFGTLKLPSRRPRLYSPLDETGPYWEALSNDAQDFARALMADVPGVYMVALTPDGADVYYRSTCDGNFDEVAEAMQANLFGSGLMGDADSVTIDYGAGRLVTTTVAGTTLLGEVERRRTRIFRGSPEWAEPGFSDGLLHGEHGDMPQLFIFDPFTERGRRLILELARMIEGTQPEPDHK